MNHSPPHIIFLTGASGAGKTTLLEEFKKNSNLEITCYHFDSIGVPSVDEMIKKFGSPSEWQREMTNRWIEKLMNEKAENKLVIIEGQVNIDFIIYAFKKFNFQHYKIILVHCANNVRHQRLLHDRNQSELVNETMDEWAAFLQKQAINKNISILDTTLMSISDMIVEFKKYLNDEEKL